MEETVKVKELSMQLDKANNEIISLKRVLNEMRMEVAELKKDKKFCIETIRGSDKDIQFYTGLPSATVFDKLLEYY